MNERKRQQQLAEALFTISQRSTNPGDILATSAIQPLIAFLEQGLQQREQLEYRPVLSYCLYCENPDQDRKQAMMDLVEDVITIMKQPTSRGISIDKVIHALRSQRGLSVAAGDPPGAVRQGIFSLLGFLTMLCMIRHPVSSTHFLIADLFIPAIYGVESRLADGRMPLGVLIGSFGRFVPWPAVGEQTAWMGQNAQQARLDVGTVNAFTLVKIGKIGIQWSSLLSAHLMFEEATGILTLFRFPTFCALSYTRGDERSVFSCIMDDSYRTPSAVAQSHNMIFREALLSYRLLFGQDERSRMLYNARKIGPAGVDDQQQPDGLLMRLCGGKESLSSLINDDSIHEKDVYDTAADFPFYSKRLIRLKELAESSRVHHSIRTLWYDGRWPKDWVLACLIGGVTILLAIVEISLAIAQAVLYVHRRDGR